MKNINLSIPYFYDFETHFTLTVEGELGNQEFDKARLLEQLKKHVYDYIPKFLHNQIQASNLVLHEHIKSFAFKLCVQDNEFYFIADNREVVGLLGSTINYHIISTDQETYEKHEKLMNLQIKQYNSEVETLARKKQEQINAEKEYKQSLNALKKVELETVYYDSRGNIDYNKTTIQALEKEGLL